ncbi:glycosyltransferase family 2 protein [Mycolicibacterium elephantis]
MLRDVLKSRPLMSVKTAQSTRTKLHVLMVHFNTPELTAHLIRDLPNETPRGRQVHIHVLDNSSTPENLQLLLKSVGESDHVSLQAINENIGFGQGMNRLAMSDAMGDSDMMWLLNPDTRLQFRCLERLELELDRGEFDIVSPLIYSGEGRNPWIWYCGGSINTRELRAPHHLFGCPLTDAPHDTFETEFVTGAAPMMHVSTFRFVGGFPRGYFLYWEDAFFSWKARELGFRLGVVPSAHLWHHIGGSSGTRRSPTYYYWTARNRFAFATDIGIPRRRLFLGRAGLESLRPIGRALAVERVNRMAKARAAIRGTLDGLRQRPRSD